VALVVIATAYTRHVSVVPLAVAVGIFAALLLLRYAPAVWRRQVAFLLGVAAWVALFKSGIDPIIAGLAAGLVTSAYPPSRSDLERVAALTRTFRQTPTPELARSAEPSAASAISGNERLQYRLHPWSGVVTVAALALP